MQRYFLKNEQFEGGQVWITGEDARHIGRVMRMKAGDTVIVCNEKGECFSSRLEEIGEEMITSQLIAALEKKSELPVEVTIAQGLPKGDKLELVIQKGTEVGAAAFLPVEMSRSVARLDEKKSAKKMQRWQKIAKEAAEQSHRQKVPRVLAPINLKGLLSAAKNYDIRLFAYEETAKSGEMAQLKKTLATVAPHQRILFLVGPEGGISPEEADSLLAAGFLPCALGPRILRTETAPLYILSAISYALEL